MPDDDVIAEWIESMQARGWAATTIEERVKLVGRIARDHGTTPLLLTRQQVRAFLACQDFRPSTRRAYWLWLRSWFGWLVEEGLRDDDPMTTIAKPKAGRRRVPKITSEHVERLLATNMRRKTRTAILLGLYQGFRVSDIAKIRGTDLDHVGGTLLADGKGDVRDFLPLHPVIAAEAEQYGPSWWFPGQAAKHVRPESVTDVIGDVMRRAGIPGTPHSLRRWYATELDRQGVPLRRISRLLRHASVATTELYILDDEADDLEAVMRLPMFGPDESETPDPLAA